MCWSRRRGSTRWQCGKRRGGTGCIPTRAISFERGADFNAAPVASALVSAILLANGGWIEGELVDVRVAALEERTARRKPIQLALSEVQRILGTTDRRRGNHRGDCRRSADGAGMRAGLGSSGQARERLRGV